jgi:hypothetical protein
MVHAAQSLKYVINIIMWIRDMVCYSNNPKCSVITELTGEWEAAIILP